MNAEERETSERLYLEMYDILIGYARSNVRHDGLAEELVQEAFRIACMNPEELCASDNPRGWMYLTLKNTIRNSRKSRENGTRLLTDYLAVYRHDIAITEDTLSLELQYGKLANMDEFRLIYEMAVDGKSHLEMAKARGISVDACKKRVQRAKEVLRKKFVK